MIFVMSGSSMVGQLAIDGLLELGIEKSSIVASVRNPNEHVTLPVEARLADYNDLESLKSAFMGVETLVLIPTKNYRRPAAWNMPTL